MPLLLPLFSITNACDSLLETLVVLLSDNKDPDTCSKFKVSFPYNRVVIIFSNEEGRDANKSMALSSSSKVT